MKQITDTRRQIKFELSPKWIRVMFGGEFIANSKRACLLLTAGPADYFFPQEDVRIDYLQHTDHVRHSSLLGDAHYWRVIAGDKIAEDAAWSYPEALPNLPDLTGYIAFEWGKMDAWFEEAEEVFVHPHNPYHRIDTLQSSRHVRIAIGDETLAESRSPVLLFETGLPTRYYLSKLDVNMDMLLPSDTVTGCAYKGKAAYYSAKTASGIIPDIAWYYTYPTLEAAKIAGRIAFYNEKVDLYVDSMKQPKQ